MMAKRGVFLSIVVGALVAIPVAQVVWSKAHVPLNKVQVCHKGEKVISVDQSSLSDHRSHGDFQVPACDFNNVFFTQDDCSFVSDGDGDGFADAGLNPRADAGGVTPACPPGAF
jgi:hypothetical protein